MAATASNVSLYPVPGQHRDIRSASVPYKRHKEQGQKWSYGARPLNGVHIDWHAEFSEGLLEGTDEMHAKSRPRKPCVSEPKSHANKMAKKMHASSWSSGKASGRIASKNDAVLDAMDASASQLKSLIDLLPQHTNNEQTAIRTTAHETAERGVRHIIDSNHSSCLQLGCEIDFEGLVELAEKKWEGKITERIVKGEYEVLDSDGETKALSRKGKKSPRQKAVRPLERDASGILDDNDGFELL